MKIRTPRIVALIIICFFLSGLLGLVYEVLWIRKLGLVFGNTVFAMTTVLSAFFGGLALGSFLFGRLSHKFPNLLKIYALIEFGIGIFAILFPSLIRSSGWFYTLFYQYIYQNFPLLTSIRFIFFALLLVIPTTLMGGTLPVLSQYFIRSKESLGLKIGILYAINTLGAAVGALLCGLYLIRFIGVDTTNYLAGILNIIIGIALYMLSQRKDQLKLFTKEPETDQYVHQASESAATSTKPNYLLICLFISGFASIGYEIAWTRYLSLPLANTRYAYTIILTVFLLGTALGSMIFARLIDKVRNSIRLFACLEIGIGIFAFILTPVIFMIRTNYIPILHDFIYSGVLMLIPTTLMGATFPVIVKALTNNISVVGYSTGRIYAFNTLGNIVGSIAAGFILIPLAGIKYSLYILVAINVSIGIFCLFADKYRNLIANVVILFTPILAFVVIGLSFKVRIPEDFLMLLKKPSEEITLIEEGMENTVWVTDNINNGQKSLWANQTVLGRTLAKEPYRVSQQNIAGHIPMLLHQGLPKNVLGICLGTGQTFGSILSYDVQIDVVEISKSITKVALENFKDYNRGLGSDKRANIIIEDGRNFVAHTKNTYDIITLEPSPPEEAGIVNLYTREFYRQSKSRLRKDGIMSQWLPLYNTHPDDTARIIKTFISVFPESILWYNTSDLILLGFNGKININIQKIGSILSKGISDLNVSYLGDSKYNLNSIESLIACFLMGPDEMSDFSDSAEIITDNHPELEYSFMKYESLENKTEMLEIYNAEKILNHLASINRYFPDLSEDESNKIQGIRKRYISHIFADAYNRIAIKKESLTEAIDFCKMSLKYNPDYGIVYANLGVYYAEQGRLLESIEAYEKSVELMPDMPKLWHQLGRSYYIAGFAVKAIEAFQKALMIKPGFSEANNDLGAVYAGLGQYDKAIEAYKKAIRSNPNYADAYYNIGLAYQAVLQIPQAIAAYKEAIRINPDFAESKEQLRGIIH